MRKATRRKGLADLRQLVRRQHQRTIFADIPFSEVKLEALVQKARHPMPNQCLIVAEARAQIVGAVWCSAGEYLIGEGALMTSNRGKVHRRRLCVGVRRTGHHETAGLRSALANTKSTLPRAVMPKGSSKGEMKFVPVHLENRTSLFVKLFLLMIFIFIILYVHRRVEYDNQYYQDVCLSGFSVENNRKEIAEYYTSDRRIGVNVVDWRDVAIYNIKREDDGRHSYQYDVLGKRGFGFGTGNNCGV